MLEKDDLKAIEEILDKRFEEVDKRFDEVDKRFSKTEKKLIKEMDKRLRNTESMLILEFDRDRKYLEEQMAVLKDRISRLEYRVQSTPYERDSNDPLLRLIEELRKEVEEIKLKIA